MHRILKISLLLTPLLTAGLLRGDDVKGPPKAPRKPVAQLVTPTASILRKDKAWEIVKEKESIYTGDMLLGGAEGAIQTTNGAIRLTLLGDMNGLSPYPIVETAIVLQPSAGADLDVTLDRGRVDLTKSVRRMAP